MSNDKLIRLSQLNTFKEEITSLIGGGLHQIN